MAKQALEKLGHEVVPWKIPGNEFLMSVMNKMSGSDNGKGIALALLVSL